MNMASGSYGRGHSVPIAPPLAREVVLLAAVLPNPLRWSAAAPSAHLRRRAAVIERRVAQIRPLLGCAR